jgi:hypothetical protein
MCVAAVVRAAVNVHGAWKAGASAAASRAAQVIASADKINTVFSVREHKSRVVD